MAKKKCSTTIIIVGLTMLLALCILYGNPQPVKETFNKTKNSKERRCVGDECDPMEGTHKCIFKMNPQGKLVRTCKRKN